MAHVLRAALAALVVAPFLVGSAVADPGDFNEIALGITNQTAGTRVTIRVKADGTARIVRTGEWNESKPVDGKLEPGELDKLRKAYKDAQLDQMPAEIVSAAADSVKSPLVEIATVVGLERRSVLTRLHFFDHAATGADFGTRLRPLLGVLTAIDVRLSKGHSREVVGSVGVTSERLLFFFKLTKVDVAENMPQTYSEVVIANNPWKKLLQGEAYTSVHLFGDVKSVKDNAGMWLSKMDVKWIKASTREDLETRTSDGQWTKVAKGTLLKVTDVKDDGRTLEIKLQDGRTARVDATKISLGRRLSEATTTASTPSPTTGMTGVLTGTVR